ncbi:DUF3866 family protein [Ornithinimicrobium sp. Arc0846-15]|nr:DUF3866 family protein [Ornithinimicrobium laminariae]
MRALAYLAEVGQPEVGDKVLLNITTVVKGLGTGGLAMMVANLGQLPETQSGPGHLVKARYTPTQTMVLGVDDQESPHHEVLADADSIGGMPVVVADLHSSLPAILAGIRLVNPGLTVAYVMADGGALPAAFSRTAATLREQGWLANVITTGQSYGGDLEAVTIHTGLLAARHIVRADIAIIAQGPGNLGTGTRWGFSGVAAGEALNAAAVLNGQPIGCLRLSGADPRLRHQGLSHHSITAYGRVLNRPATLALPDLSGSGIDEDLRIQVEQQVADLVGGAAHLGVATVSCAGGLAALEQTPVRLSTMGRGLSDDPIAFLAAMAAGRLAADQLQDAPRDESP